MMEIGRVYVARNGLKAFFYWKAFFGVLPPGSKGEHPLDLVEPTNVMVRIPEKHLKWRVAPELKGRPA